MFSVTWQAVWLMMIEVIKEIRRIKEQLKKDRKYIKTDSNGVIVSHHVLILLCRHRKEEEKWKESKKRNR